MAIDEPERRADSVAVSRSTVRFVAALATAFVLGVSTVLWNVVVGHVRLVEQVTFLEEFGPQYGERFTAKDGDGVRQEIKDLKQWVLEIQKNINSHAAKGEHEFAGRRLDTIERWIREHEAKSLNGRNGNKQ